MPRPHSCRRISGLPATVCFKPAGIPMRMLETVTLRLDEVEAVRLADLEEMYQEDAASSMGVSRQTFGNIVASARRKIADAIVNGRALVIEGGNVTVAREFPCRNGMAGAAEAMEAAGTGGDAGRPGCGRRRRCGDGPRKNESSGDGVPGKGEGNDHGNE